jgi:hypothetical protein
MKGEIMRALPWLLLLLPPPLRAPCAFWENIIGAVLCGRFNFCS